MVFTFSGCRDDFFFHLSTVFSVDRQQHGGGLVPDIAQGGHGGPDGVQDDAAARVGLLREHRCGQAVAGGSGGPRRRRLGLRVM